VYRAAYGQKHGIIHHSILLDRVMFNTIVPNRTQVLARSTCERKENKNTDIGLWWMWFAFAVGMDAAALAIMGVDARVDGTLGEFLVVVINARANVASRVLGDHGGWPGDTC
jgi:hypothetical protein